MRSRGAKPSAPISSTAQLPLRVQRRGLVPYEEAQHWQRQLVEQRKQDLIEDQLLLLTHPNVITLGRSLSRRFLRCDESTLAELGYSVVEAGRGGEVTYHGPGQLVVYPILKLREHERDLHLYLRRLEEVGLAVCQAFSVQAERHRGKTGVWIRGKKVMAIGVRACSWVTFHGLALNHTAQQEGFKFIVPCGLPGVEVTSLEEATGYRIDRNDLEEVVVEAFSSLFSRAPIKTYPEEHPNLRAPLGHLRKEQLQR